jgi:hypothetical protein
MRTRSVCVCARVGVHVCAMEIDWWYESLCTCLFWFASLENFFFSWSWRKTLFFLFLHAFLIASWSQTCRVTTTMQFFSSCIFDQDFLLFLNMCFLIAIFFSLTGIAAASFAYLSFFRGWHSINQHSILLQKSWALAISSSKHLTWEATRLPDEYGRTTMQR